MVRKIRGLAKQSLLSQVRETRQQYWDDNHEEQKSFYDKARAALAELDMSDHDYEAAVQRRDEAATEWHAWFEDNYPGTPKDRAAERTKLKKKSKRTARSRITITDHDLLDDRVEEAVIKVEWADWLSDGSLVMTKKGELGMVVMNQDIGGYRTPDDAVKYGGQVQIMIDGDLRWYRKINLRPLDD